MSLQSDTTENLKLVYCEWRPEGHQTVPLQLNTYNLYLFYGCVSWFSSCKPYIQMFFLLLWFSCLSAALSAAHTCISSFSSLPQCLLSLFLSVTTFWQSYVFRWLWHALYASCPSLLLNVNLSIVAPHMRAIYVFFTVEKKKVRKNAEYRVCPYKKIIKVHLSDACAVVSNQPESVTLHQHNNIYLLFLWFNHTEQQGILFFFIDMRVTDMELHYPFLCFSTENVLVLISAIMTQQRIVFLSSNYSLLTLIIEVCWSTFSFLVLRLQN